MKVRRTGRPSFGVVCRRNSMFTIYPGMALVDFERGDFPDVRTLEPKDLCLVHEAS